MTKCSICSHPQVEEINNCLLLWASRRSVARNFCIGRYAVTTHARLCLNLTEVRANAHRNTIRAKKLQNKQIEVVTLRTRDDIESKLEWCYSEAWAMLEMSKAMGDLRGMGAALTQINAILDKRARMLGMYKNPEFTVDLHERKILQIASNLTDIELDESIRTELLRLESSLPRALPKNVDDLQSLNLSAAISLNEQGKQYNE